MLAAWAQLLAVVPLAAVLAIGVWRVREGHRGANALIAMLVLEACAMLFWGTGKLLGEDYSQSFAAIAVMLFGASAVTYMLVIRTLNTNMTKPFENTWVVVTIAVLIIGPGLFAIIRGYATGYFAPFRENVLHEHATAQLTGLVTTTMLSMYALIAAILAWWKATPDSTNRRRAGAFALAFGTRDVVFTFAVGGTILLGLYGPDHQAWAMLFWPLASLLYMPLVVFAILRYHLLDIELRAKVTIKGSTITIIVAGSMLVGGEIFESWLGVEQWYAAAAIGALAAFLARPISKVGSLVADKFLPGVENTPAYRTIRACELYQRAFEDSMVDGNLNDKERRMLDRLAENLNLAADVVKRIEGAGPGVPHPPPASGASA